MARTRSRCTVALLVLTPLAGLASAIGCSDADPNYGPPGIIKGREVDFGIDAGGPVGEASSTQTAVDAFAALHKSISGTCAPCHNATPSTGAPPFLANSPADSRLFFQKNGYTTEQSAFFLIKAGHPGGALSDDQKTLFRNWIAAEARESGGGGG
jgi:hypothetical protein